MERSVSASLRCVTVLNSRLQRYGASLRKQVKKVRPLSYADYSHHLLLTVFQMEITQHARYTCTFCGKARNWLSKVQSSG